MSSVSLVLANKIELFDPELQKSSSIGSRDWLSNLLVAVVQVRQSDEDSAHSIFEKREGKVAKIYTLHTYALVFYFILRT